MRVLITGGAGFVGSNLACALAKKTRNNQVVVLDNLKRRGSEFNLTQLKSQGVEFIHGDIRSYSDLEDLTGSFDTLIEASAEPSVLAGLTGSPQYLLNTNLVGTLNCLEFARKRVGTMVFLSTSRVYSMSPLKKIVLNETEDRFEMASNQVIPGLTSRGISEGFPTHLARSLYGASKLASEYMIQEYVDTYNMRAVINRCGVIAGPGQFGKVDQGVFTLWVAHHYFGKPLKYTGFGGAGKQVRDLIHPQDLFTLVSKQIEDIVKISGDVFNVGGGEDISVSLKELTQICREVTGHEVPIGQSVESHPVDIPYYVTDYSKAQEVFHWAPEKSATTIVQDILSWITENEDRLEPFFGA